MLGLLSMIEPTFVDEALSDDEWIVVMQEELDQFQTNDVYGILLQNYIRRTLLEKNGCSETSLMKKVKLLETKQDL